MARHRHVEPMNLWELLFPGKHLCDRLTHLEMTLMSKFDELTEAIAQVGTDLGEAVTRIEAKLAESDVDLTDELAALRSYGETLDSIAAEPVPEPDPETPVDPDAPVDPELPA